MSELKPTTPEEREEREERAVELRDLLQHMPTAARRTREEREFILRLIADVNRLTAAVAKHRADVWGTGPVKCDHDTDLYQEVLDAAKD